MKKRILLLIVMLLTIIVTSAQTAGATFDDGEFAYIVLADVATVQITGKSAAGFTDDAVAVPTIASDGVNSFAIASIGDSTFIGETGISTLTVAGATNIGIRAFEACPNLTTVTANLTTVLGSNAFLSCPLLDTANFNGLTTVGLYGFRYCTSLTTFSATSLVSGGGAQYMFEGCTELTTVSLPVLAGGGGRMFKNCDKLQTIDLPDMTSANINMFESCDALTSVEIPSLITAPKNMFLDCVSLENVTATSLATGGITMFKNCTSLQSINLPALVTSGNLSFQGCTGLKNVYIPVIETLSSGTFNNTGLKSIVFPAVLSTIAGTNNHFAGAQDLKYVVVENPTPVTITTDLFTSAGPDTAPTGVTLIVPTSAAGTAYSAATGWQDLSIFVGSLSIPPVTLTATTTTTLGVTTTDVTYSANGVTTNDYVESITYKRNLGTENWYLMSSPISNEMYNDAYVAANSIDATSILFPANNAIATYTSNGNTWSYMQDGNDLPFTPGVGYSVKREDAAGAGDVSFTGSELNKGDINGVSVSTDTDGFNLLGNPYLTNINSKIFLEANTNLSQEIWLFDQSSGNYDNHVATDEFIVASGQGFFVKAESGTAVNFTEATQDVATGTFQKTATSKIKLLINSGDTERYAKIYFTASATAGFDRGMDGERFTGVANKMDVFTQLLENNTGKNYQIQSLPMANIEATVVPVGLIVEAGKQISFSAEALNLPDGLKVFLEDRQTNTFTRLDEENSKYEVTLSDKLEGTGRFFLHTSTSSVLSIDSTILEGVSVYKSNASTLRIVGLSQGNATVKLFNVLGKQMMKTSFETSGSDEVSLSNLATGVYIVQLETENGQLNKKIILE